jgi:hypothetical protein
VLHARPATGNSGGFAKELLRNMNFSEDALHASGNESIGKEERGK